MAVAPTYVGSAKHGLPTEVPGASRDFAIAGTVGASDTYVTGGFAFSPATVGLTAIHYCNPILFSTGHWGYFIPGSNLIKVFSAAATELANASAALQNATFVVTGSGR